MVKRTYSLNLAKGDVADFEELLTESGSERLGQAQSRLINLPAFADGGRLFLFRGGPMVPPWLRDLEGVFGFDAQFLTSSLSGVLAFRASGRMFAVTFGQGWAYLNPRALERDFGLRASINALDVNRLKRLDRTNLADALRGTALSPFQRDLGSFGIDDALELVRTVSGRTRDGVTADMLSGASALKWNAEIAIPDLPDVAEEALALFESDAYLGTAFEIVDLLRPVVDIELIEVLNEQAALSIRGGEANFELGLPAHVSEASAYYRFIGLGGRDRYADLNLEAYVRQLGESVDDLNAAALFHHQIIAEFEQAGIPNAKWSVHSSLVGSIAYAGGRYAINEGSWYRVDEQFRESVDASFAELVADDWDQQPLPFRTIASVDGRKRTYQSEESYNAEAAQHLGLICMDQRLIAIPGGGRTRFEVCDLLDLPNKKLIHVKKSSRRSSVLSHLFKQGSNSAQQLKIIPGCFDNIRDELLAVEGAGIVQQLDAALADDHGWSVEFWIADSIRQGGQHRIPFFSRITLRDEARHLRGMGYDVRVRFITLPAPA